MALHKQTSRIVLLLGATAIVALTLWSSGRIARSLRAEEQRKVELWSEAIVQRAELVRYTDALFASLRTEERDKADLMGEAYRIIQEAEPGAPIDLTFITRFIQGNRTIPVLVYNDVSCKRTSTFRRHCGPGAAGFHAGRAKGKRR